MAAAFALRNIDATPKVPIMSVIGSDSGYLMAPAKVTSLTMAPGERHDILVDFSAVPVGTKII